MKTIMYLLNSSEKYNVIRGIVSDYMRKSYNGDVSLDSINFSFICDFESYLRKSRKFADSTTTLYLKLLKSAMNYALLSNWIKENPFDEFVICETPREPVFLTKEELNCIEQKNITNEQLCQVRDVFVFVCYTGLRFEEIENLNEENFHCHRGGSWITYTCKMSSRQYKVPLSDAALKIVKRYSKRLPLFSLNRMNLCLKKIATQCDINKILTFYVARSTFKKSMTWLDFPQNVLFIIMEQQETRQRDVYVPKSRNKTLQAQ
jgi:Site-specific recombinase XerD